NQSLLEHRHHRPRAADLPSLETAIFEQSIGATRASSPTALAKLVFFLSGRSRILHVCVSSSSSSRRAEHLPHFRRNILHAGQISPSVSPPCLVAHHRVCVSPPQLEPITIIHAGVTPWTTIEELRA
ncbi:hypothetical protein Dimus_030132, partial [Dionaea muscipula]